MIIVTYPQENTEILEIKDRLVDLCLSFHLNMDESAEDITLQEGKIIKTGLQDILEYLDELSHELDQWWHCYC